MFSNLLPDILNIIFDYAIDGDAHTVQAWKQDLPVLAVCHNWRLLGMSRVYNTVIIESKSVGQPPTEPQRFIDRDPAFGVAASNLELAASVGALPLLQKLVMNMNYNMGLVHYFDKVLQLLKSHMDVCSNLTTFWTCLRSSPNPAYWSGEMAMEEKVNEQTHQLVAALSNIKHIMAMTLQDKGLSKHVITKLMDKYAHQLIDATCYFPIDLTAPQFSKKQTHLNILLRLDNNPLPKVNLDTLKNLRVYDIVRECQRGTFYSASNGQAKMFEFNSLKYLNLRNSGEDCMHSDSPLYSMMSFPCLSVMYIDTSHTTDRLLTHAHFPEYIDKLMIKTWQGRITLYNVKFGIAERVQFAKHTREKSNLNYIAFARYLVNAPQLYSELHLEFPSNNLFPVHKLRLLEGLKTLVMINTTPLRILKVVMSIRSLKKLTVGELKMDVEPLNYEDGRDNNLLSIASSIEHVQVKCIKGNVDQTFTSLFERVLAQTQSLKWLDIPKDVQVCSSLIDQFGVKRPHIQQLHISAKY